MLPTKQTILHDPANGLQGNCLSAVLASLLHLPIDDIPVFKTPETWVRELNLWLRPFGLAYCMVADFDCHIDAYGITGLWHEVSGNTARSADVTHACVALDGNLVFDPHPSDTGLTELTCHGFFIVLEPWTHASRSGDAAADRPSLACDLCGIEITDFYTDLFHHTGRLNGAVNGHLHLCAACNRSVSPPIIDFDQLLRERKGTEHSINVNIPPIYNPEM